MINTDVAEIAGLVAECILYGILLVLTAGTLYILLIRGRRRHTSVNIPMVATSILMITLATAQMIVDCVAIVGPFITMTRAERLAFFHNNTIPINVSKHAIFFTMMILGDVIVIYRCWVVYERKLLVVTLPILFSLTSAVLAYLTIWSSGHPIEGALINKKVFDYGVVLLTFSLASNLIASSLLAYRIWSRERQFTGGCKDTSISTNGSSESTRRSLYPIVRVIIESGILNIGYLCAYMGVLYSTKISGATAIMACIASPMVGIIFSMVIIRVGMQSQSREASTTRHDNPTQIQFNRSGRLGGGTDTTATMHSADIDGSELELNKMD